MLNARHSVEELNFDCGHELIHLTKHRGLGLSSFHCFDTLKPKQDPFIEWEANEGAAELTVPYRSFLPLLSDAYPQLRTWQDMDFLRYRLARRYQVTETVIAYRMESLKYEFFQYLSGTPLEDLHFLSRRELSKQGVSILSLNELEDRFTKFQEPNQSLKTPRCFGSDDCYQGAFRFLGKALQNNPFTVKFSRKNSCFFIFPML